MRRHAGLAASLGVVLLLGACGSSGEEAVENMTGLIVETAAANRGPGEFADAGVQISGPLSCRAEPADSQFAITCTGTALDGREVTLSGTATSAPGGSSVAGQFTGTAAGAQVFTTECLGDC